MLNYIAPPIASDKELDESNKSLVITNLKKTCQFEQICPERLQDRPPKVNVIFRRTGMLEFDESIDYYEFKTKEPLVIYYISYNLLLFFRKFMERKLYISEIVFYLSYPTQLNYIMVV